MFSRSRPYGPSATNMFSTVSYLLALPLLLVAAANAQSVFFTQYPTQVISGLTYPVAWEAGGASITLDLLKGGQYQETLFTGAGTAFTWNVEDDDDGGLDYALRITPQGNEGAALTSGTIWVIEDEDGLTVNGQVITASVPNGPTPSGLSSAAVSTSVVATGTGNTATTATTPNVISTPTGPRTEVVTFSSAQSIYTFTTTVVQTATNALPAEETLTFTSSGLTFTTTISAATANSTATASAIPVVPNAGGGGLSGGAIAGIVIGVLIIVLLILAFLWFYRRRQRQRASQNGVAPQSPFTTFINGGRRALSNRKSAVSAADTTRNEDEKIAQRQSLVSPLSPDAPKEMDTGALPVGAQQTGSSPISPEIDGQMRHEMNALPPTYELAAEDVPRDSPSQSQYPATCVEVSRTGTTINNTPT